MNRETSGYLFGQYMLHIFMLLRSCEQVSLSLLRYVTWQAVGLYVTTINYFDNSHGLISWHKH